MKVITTIILLCVFVPNSINKDIIFILRGDMRKVYYRKNDLYWLALNIYYEARGETLHGRMAVAFVTLNRVGSSRFPDTIEEVVKQNNQFSWYKKGKTYTPSKYESWKAANYVAELCLELYNTAVGFDPTRKDWIVDGALFYYAHNKIKEPYWVKAEKMVVTTVIGNHTFLAI